MEFYLKEWHLVEVDSNVKIDVKVPGDITNDLHQAGLIKDPYFGYNHHDCYDMCKKDYVYKTQFDLPEKIDYSKENLHITFYGKR